MNIKFFKRQSITALFIILCFSTNTTLAKSSLLTASASSMMGISLGSEVILEAGSQLTIDAVESLANGTQLLITVSVDGVKHSFNFTTDLSSTVAQLSVDSIRVTAISTGWLLVAASEVIAFIPNAMAEDLLFHLDHGQAFGEQSE